MKALPLAFQHPNQDTAKGDYITGVSERLLMLRCRIRKAAKADILRTTAARAFGADQVKILHHTNSGDVTGDRTPSQYTVGYMAAAVYKST